MITCALCCVLPNTTATTKIMYWNRNMSQIWVKNQIVVFLVKNPIWMVILLEVWCKCVIINIVRYDKWHVTLMLPCITLILLTHILHNIPKSNRVL